MSGAESVAGLAVGVVALASLFSTCVELLDYCELGRNIVHDYDLACTKIGILHERLCIWGASIQIEQSGIEHHSLQDPAKRDAVVRGLVRLGIILSSTETLKKKYGSYSTAVHRSNQRLSAKQVSHLSLSLRRRTTWSIRDKAKFDKLIDDISFLIENLEKITEQQSSKDSMAAKGARSIEQVTKVTQTVYAEHQLALETRPASEAIALRGSKSLLAVAQQDCNECKTPPSDLKTMPLEATVRQEDLEQINEGAGLGVQGILQESASATASLTQIRGKQINRGTGMNVQGVASGMTLLLALQKQPLDMVAEVRLENGGRKG